MKCSYLEAEPVERCLAHTDGIRIISDRELKEFCCTKDYVSCQIYQRRVAGKKTLSKKAASRQN